MKERTYKSLSDSFCWKLGWSLSNWIKTYSRHYHHRLICDHFLDVVPDGPPEDWAFMDSSKQSFTPCVPSGRPYQLLQPLPNVKYSRDYSYLKVYQVSFFCRLKSGESGLISPDSGCPLNFARTSMKDKRPRIEMQYFQKVEQAIIAILSFKFNLNTQVEDLSMTISGTASKLTQEKDKNVSWTEPWKHFPRIYLQNSWWSEVRRITSMVQVKNGALALIGRKVLEEVHEKIRDGDKKVKKGGIETFLNMNRAHELYHRSRAPIFKVPRSVQGDLDNKRQRNHSGRVSAPSAGFEQLTLKIKLSIRLQFMTLLRNILAGCRSVSSFPRFPPIWFINKSGADEAGALLVRWWLLPL